jgi:type IV pilus assembly protein PilW
MTQKQSGMTLIELVISMLLSLFLIAGMSQIFMQSQKNFALERHLADMTEDAVFVLDLLSKNLSLAGYSSDGKMDLFKADTAVIGSKMNFNQDEYIRGLDDELIYRFKISDDKDLNNSLCTSSLKYNQNDILTIYIYENKDSDGIPVFYCKVKQSSVTEPFNAKPLISQVEKLEFRYGVQNKNDVNNPDDDTFYYAKADDINDWKNVFAVKVFLVMRSADNNVTSAKMKYTIENTAYTASDNRLYHVFSKIIYLQALAQ